MTITTRQLTLLILVVGLAAVTIVEALRPASIGAATNLGVVTLVAGMLLVMAIKNPLRASRRGKGGTARPAGV